MAAAGGSIDLAEGDVFAGYRIERRLDRGGMGVLYLAVEPGLERRVALKLIAPEAAADEVFARRFAEESRIAASIEHPNVVPIYAAGEEEGVPFIAMRYVAGSDLGKRIAREGRLLPETATALIAQVGNGLDAIHAAGLVHRDVKPANVLLSQTTGDEHAYITDFGVARNVATASGLTQTGRFVGTLDYVAPEQISGGEVDARVDVYALGCLLYKLLTGEVPFPRDGEAAKLYAHLNDPAPAPSPHAPLVPMALDEVVLRAMSKSPDDRYPSAGDLGRAAEAALSGKRPAQPERTVATGAAATRTAETLRLEAEPPDAPAGPAKSRRLLWAGGLSAIATAAAVAIALGGEGSDGSNPRVAASAGGPASKPLTKAELIRRADEVCEDSKGTYSEVRNAELEKVPDVEYAEALVGISTPGVRRLRELKPPPELRSEYSRYVQAQQRVHRYDVEALRAARSEDGNAYLAARRRRDSEEGDREALARSIGFRVCSIPQE